MNLITDQRLYAPGVSGANAGHACGGAAAPADVAQVDQLQLTDTQAGRGAGLLSAPNATGNQALLFTPGGLRTGEFEKSSRGARTDAIRTELRRINELLRRPNGLLPEGYREELMARRAMLRKRVRRAAALEWLTQTAWATGAPRKVLEALDTAPIKVVKDSRIESDAAFDEKSGRILVKQSLIKSIHADINELDDRGIVDANTGKVLDPSRLRSTDQYHNFVVTQALIGAHEVGHSHDDHNAADEAAKAALQPAIRSYLAATGNERAALGQQLVHDYIANFEYEQYLRQEQYQFKMGEAPEQTSWMTIDNSGAPVDRELAVSRLVSYLTARGFNADVVVSIAGTPAQAQQVSELYGGPQGGRFPGGRFPGGRFPGGRFPGGRFPGGRFPGGRFPGSELC